MYRLKPLDWRQLRDAAHEDGEAWAADTVFGSIEVERIEYRGYVWKYCFDEFYDEDSHDCESIAAGKDAAEEFYRRRILPALEAV